MPNIRHQLLIEATPKQVYDAITTENGIKGWWSVQTIAKAEVGFVNEQRFGEEYFNKMKVTALEANKRVDWKCIDGDPEWIGTDLFFEIKDHERGVLLQFAHLNWKDETEFYANCNHHWGRFLDSMKSLCESGVGKPFRPS